ncbi:MAG: cytochrome P450 [Pseudomonadota bacterium]
MDDNQAVYQVSREITNVAEPSEPTLTSFDIDWWELLTDPEFLGHPYPELNRIRDLAPIHYDSVSGIYFVLGYYEFRDLATAPELGRDVRYWSNSWSSPENKAREPETYELFTQFQPQMINVNPPDHTRMRNVYERAFRRDKIAETTAMIEVECQALLDTLPLDTPFNYMTTFANLLPLHVALNLFEMPKTMTSKVAEWISALSWLGNIIVTQEQKKAARVAQDEFTAYVREILFSPERDSFPKDGFIGLTISALENGVMNEEEAINNVAMLISGNKTTPSLLGNGLLTLLKHPEQLDKLRANRSLLRNTVEEMLRYEPGSSIIPRAAVSDIKIGDVLIPASSLCIGLVGGVTRDPAYFKDPDVFDITRIPSAHLVFGRGPHVCIGKELARLVAEVTLTALMDQFSSVELAGKPEWRTDRSDQHELNALPLQLSK